MAHDHAPLPAPVKETIDLWISDFLERPVAGPLAARVGPDAASVLERLLEGACHGGTAPADLEAEQVAHGYLDHVAELPLGAARHAGVPDLVAAFLEDLETSGRLAGGRAMGARARAAASAYRDRASGRPVDLTRKASKVGRNDPCPCGSGRKYKQCCLR